MGLEDAMVTGDYFGPDSTETVAEAEADTGMFTVPIPVILASQPYVENADEYLISRLPQQFAEQMPVAEASEQLFADLATADTTEVDRLVVDASEAYDELFGRRHQQGDVTIFYPHTRFWVAGDVTHSAKGERSVAAEPVSADPNVWRTPPLFEGHPGVFSAPDAAADSSFRPLDVFHALERDGPQGVQFVAVGSFDPELLAASTSSSSCRWRPTTRRWRPAPTTAASPCLEVRR